MSGAWAIGSGVVRAADGRSWVQPGGAGAGDERVAARIGRVERPAALALEAAAAVWPDPPADPPTRAAGVALGTMLGCFATNVAFERRLVQHGPAGASPRLFASTVSNAAAGEVGIAYGLGGPALTVTAGMAGGSAALEAALGELAAGGVERMVVLAVDVVGGAGRRWLREMAFGAPGPGEQLAALTLARADRVAEPLGVVEGVATGYAPRGQGARVVGIAERALAAAGRTADEVALCTTRGTTGDAVAARLAVPEVRPLPELAVGLSAAGGLAALLCAGGSRRRPTLVVDACPSGHVAACVAWSSAP